MRSIVVEDDSATRAILESILLDRNHEVETFGDAESALESCRIEQPALILLDLTLPGMDGLRFCQQVRGMTGGDRILIVVLTGRDHPDDIRAALDAGADDYVVKPIIRAILDVRLQIAMIRIQERAARRQAEATVLNLRDMLTLQHQLQSLVGKSGLMQRLFRQIQNLSQVDSTVLVEGETGTGKELVARALHELSTRKDGPFIAVNSAGLTESVLASQLFGHRRGSFTGAIADQKGFFEAAHKGTIFLDEIGDIPPTVQTNLLRVLQEREIVRLGESTPHKVDVRVIAATHRDLNHEVAQGRFRADLLYRIRVTRLQLPPLRERREDIPLLARHFIEQAGVVSGKSVGEIESAVMRVLIAYDWPGNVRELKSAIECAVVSSDSPIVTIHDLPPELRVGESLPRTMGDRDGHADRDRIRAALDATGGDRNKAARLLGMSRATLYRRLAETRLQSTGGTSEED